MKKAFKITGVTIGIILVVMGALAAYVQVALPNAGPAPDLHVEITKERVTRGEYLAHNVMLCMDCHSTRNWREYGGPMQPGTLGKGGDVFDEQIGFPGKYYAKNITPAGIGNWTDGEIFRAITTGVTKKEKAIFPVMPYHLFGQADEEDIKSVIAYLRTIPPIDNKVPESKSDFPMNFILPTIPEKAHLQKKPDELDTVAYGKYLVTIAACQDCHTPFVKGKFIDSLQFAGGREFDLPTGMVTTANLTPDVQTGIGSWTKPMFIARFSVFRDSAMQHKPITMSDYQTVMPWTMYSRMTDKDLGCIYDYLHTLQPKKHPVTKFKPPVKKAS